MGENYSILFIRVLNGGTDAEDALPFVDDRTRRAAEVKLVADPHCIHVLREPSAIRKLRVLVLVVGLDDQPMLALALFITSSKKNRRNHQNVSFRRRVL